ncbi:MAG TPA: glycosyltransferase [Opitutus sp.]|nr:glycosyltransferase [Opitutus sp.]
MRCCQIVPSLEEQYGGPSKSVLALSRALAAAGTPTALHATHPSTPSRARDGSFELQIFRRDPPARLCRSRALRKHLEAQAACDVVHHHSLWLRTLHYAHCAARARSIPLVISPRGMLSDWAWEHHPWRKRLAQAWVHPGALAGAAGWHVTSSQEADEVRARGFKQPICVAPNGIAPADPGEREAAAAHWRARCGDVSTKRTALFYSRLHRKKRVLELIDLWLQVAPPEWLLLVVGIPEDYTPAQLETYVMRASGAGRVRAFDGRDQLPPYPVAELFLLPSHNENFGMVIAEALANGLPALVTDSTPWSELNARGAGWCVPWQDYGNTLQAALKLEPAELARRGEAGRRHVLEHYSWARSAEILAAFYRQLGDGASAR